MIWKYLINIIPKRDEEHFDKIIQVEEQTENVYFDYMPIYLLPCLGLNLNNIMDVFGILFVMILVAIVMCMNLTL